MGKALKGRPVCAEGGFTLTEVMVTVAVLAVIMAIAIPSMTVVVNNNRLTAQSNELVAALQHARSEAVKFNAPVSVCKSTDGATCSTAAGTWAGWITVVDATGEVLRSRVLDGPVQMTSDFDAVTFRGDGLARAAAGGLLTADAVACLPTEKPVDNQRVVSIRSGSRISTESRSGAGACP